MPTVLTNLTRRRVMSLQSSALFLAPRHMTLGIAMNVGQRGFDVIVATIVLADPNASGRLPVQAGLHHAEDDDVVDYGSDWVLEVLQAPSKSEGGDRAPTGSIVISPDGPVLCVETKIDGGRIAKRVKLADMKFTSLSSEPDEIWFGHWRIWLNEAERNRPGATPIFEWPPKPA